MQTTANWSTDTSKKNECSLKGEVQYVTFHNDQNDYSVLKVAVGDNHSVKKCVGTVVSPAVGFIYIFQGHWEIDKRFGNQFHIESYEEDFPISSKGIENYLASGAIGGIGKKYAKEIVKAFGTNTFSVIEKNPERLLDIPGIGEKRQEQIVKGLEAQREIRRIKAFLHGLNIGTANVQKIYEQYGKNSVSVIRENPYRLADEISGIGFQTADEIGKQLGFDHNGYPRIRSGILYTLDQAAKNGGHCFLWEDSLKEESAKLLNVDSSLITEAITKMGTGMDKRDIIIENVVKSPLGDYYESLENWTEDLEKFRNIDVPKANILKAVYLPIYYFSEKGCARELIRISTGRAYIKVQNDDDFADKIKELSGVNYADSQIEAIRTAVNNKVMILTGGPGTGKTTTVRGIIKVFSEIKAKILLAAPTGRAAKRLSESTDMPAKTIHRLLEAGPNGEFGRNKDRPLKGDVLIVDECSMIDILLMYKLMQAIPNNMSVILVGDIDQLPSVGAGNVLRDIIASKEIPVVCLTEIFRQAQESRIVTNAYKINKGYMPDCSNGHNSDFFFREMKDVNEAAKWIVQIVKTNLPDYYKVQPTDIQVLCPTKKRGVTGTQQLNLAIQEAVNPEGNSVKHGDTIFRVNDRVMHIRNNYEKNVFNGDTGIVKSADEGTDTLVVKYDEHEVTYIGRDMDELVLAYAITIHKSQGSEYPIVIIPLSMSDFTMLERNLVYTGVTRAKKICIIVGTRNALWRAVSNPSAIRRNTMLKERLMETV